MNGLEAGRITAAINALRPDWPRQQLATLLAHDDLRDRPRRDVALALTYVACEADSRTPYRVLEDGPWWAAAGGWGDETAVEDDFYFDESRMDPCPSDLTPTQYRDWWTGQVAKQRQAHEAHREAHRAQRQASRRVPA